MADPYLPGLLIVGPRATGKTTTEKTTTARRHPRSIVHLDQDVEAEQFRADPDVALVGLPEPVLLDEWQAVPGVLGGQARYRQLAAARPFHRHGISS